MAHGHDPGRGRFPRRPARPLCPGRRFGRRAGGASWRASAISAGRLDRDKHASDLKAALGGLKGPLMKAAQLICHHPRRAAAGICPRAGPAPGQCAGHGLGLRAPAHGDRAGAGLAGEVRALRQGSLVRRLARARSIARRCPTAREARPEAAISRHGLGARSRPQPAQARVRHRPALRPGHPHRRDPCRDHRRACARSSTIGARPGTSRSTATCCATRPSVHVPEVVPSHFDRPAADHELAAGRAAAQLEEPLAGGARRARHPHVPRLVRAVLFLRRDPWRPASRQLHGAARRLGQPDGFRLRAHLPAALRARLDRALSRADDRRPGPRRRGLRGLGLHRPDAAR